MSNYARPPPRRGASGAWNRLKHGGPTDPLDVYGLPSKGEMRLHDYKAQESYYAKIVERYMKFCALSGGGDGLEAAFASLSVRENNPLANTGNGTSNKRPPLTQRPSDTARPNDLPNILLAMRRLREGILGSRRTDHFAQRAYMFIIHASILTKSWESYLPALQYLLGTIHRHTPLSLPEMQEFSGYHILDLACRQDELLEAFAARLRFKNRDRRIATIIHALVHDDWVRYWRTKRAVDGYQRAIMEYAVERMRLHALKCLGRGYLNADRAFVERSGDKVWEELVKSGVGWQLQDSGNVVIRKPKPK
ncbi:hypothetical protein CKM354_000190600 [Cercospora kikuchii]|uniref:CSN8/PSMD8/EIF3K domain-containing protein n=1 Tax=Cercospora kikuchii TaxID=84275 RepID=A0A9P3FD58_9PEZI|nr:uncharacterized protein CKM354_000190600 [Cercospora kikuchii]GIZ38489.1 hypothetical protein CKM354_000190600 [Cercospora kikuchii]